MNLKSVQAQNPFSDSELFIFTNASLKGTYAGVLSGTLVGTPPVPGAVAFYFTADGNGNVTNTNATVNINGQIFDNIQFPGTYKVNVDGTIDYRVVPINGPLKDIPITARGVVTETDGGRITEYRDVYTGPSIVATSVMKRIMRN
jgi:hypothetical protein